MKTIDINNTSTEHSFQKPKEDNSKIRNEIPVSYIEGNTNYVVDENEINNRRIKTLDDELTPLIIWLPT